MAARVLIVDDEQDIRSTLAQILSDEGFATLDSGSGAEALELYAREQPDVVLLDVWLPDKDGLEVLAEIRATEHPAPVIMISGHGTVSTAVRAIQMGAVEYLEKPPSYDQVVRAVSRAIADRGPAPARANGELEPSRGLEAPPLLPLIQPTAAPQRTIARSTVVYGLGLHSGTKTGMVLQPLPVDSGIHFHTLPTGTIIPAHVSAVGDTDYATTLVRDGVSVKTIEHLLSALHAHGVTNLLVKVHGEVPVLDGSAIEFCRLLAEVGVQDQEAPRRELVIDQPYEVAGRKGQRLRLEPFDGFRVSYQLRYPPPVGEQFYDFTLASPEAYRDEIAPARTFGFMRDLEMLNKLGLGSGGRLDNFILVGEDNVINTALRFPDEFVRHKILDIIGDLYLLGYPVRGRVIAELSGHRDNVAILRQIWERNTPRPVTAATPG
jgi:UDP-3-O-[3-hydroxymyristoyl] N-acetylglucosamine deacetylase